MTKPKKLTTLLLTLALVITLVPMTADAAGISKRKVSLYVGQTTTLKAGAKAKWKSGNKSVATVSKKGVVKAKKAGKTTITAKAGKKTYRCSVTVKNPKLNSTSMELDQGETETIKATGASIKQCRSGNTRIARVTRKGVVRGVSKGSTTITVTLSNWMKYSIPVTVYGDDDDVSVQNDNPTATRDPNCAHVWEEVSVRYRSSGWLHHTPYTLYRCSKCELEKEEHPEKNVKCSIEEVVLKEPTCTEDGENTRVCTLCGDDFPYQATEYNGQGRLGGVIPRTGHDFEYTYKKEVVVKDDWDLRYDYNNEHGYESMGERTATCKTCGESFEEVGFDTGVELEDGSQAVIWGVYEKDAVPYIIEWINKYREGHESEDGETLSLLTETEALNNYALFRASQFCARKMLNCKGQMGKGWVTRAGFCDAAPVGEKINLISAFIKLGGSFQSEKIRYSGGAHFRYETENGEFMDVLVAVGDDYNEPLITCEKNQHDEDYAGICHRCGSNAELFMDEDDEGPYMYSWVHITNGEFDDHSGIAIERGSFDIDHDGVCDGCAGPMLLAAGRGTWNYCNVALFGYGGMDFSNCIRKDGDYYFEQPNWREKLESYIANGERIEAEIAKQQ